ncbi:CheR family methyltransferase [Kribbella sp. NPDC023855]|uniref:CheR family methyltransferase n=1 Tax=Kribbella sp. NPDC023855 TaxID=3154698 RepID=UPI0033D1F2E5
MLLAEELGSDAYLKQVKIYATDIDDEALGQARHAAYQEAELEGVPWELRTKYFEKRGDRFVFTPELRRTVIFGRNDLVQDAPISRVDLLLCRNTLMYFNAETQQRVLNRFHFALVPRGVLFLGRAEMLLGRSRMFEPIDLKQRIFRRVADRSMTSGRRPGPSADVPVTDRLRELARAANPIAQLVVGLDDTLVMQSDQAGNLFGVSRRDVGRPVRELEVSYQPLALRGHLDQVIAERKPIRALRQEVERAGRQLEATNAELQIINEAVRERSTELNDVNDFLQAVLTVFAAGVIVVDLEMRILAWNAAAQELWGVRSDEAEGQHLLNLDVGLPADVLRPLVRAALSDPESASETRLDAVNRRGRAIVVRLLCSALRGPDGQQRGVLLTMEPV